MKETKMVSFRLLYDDYVKLCLISHRLYGTLKISKTIKALLYSFIKDEWEKTEKEILRDEND